MSSCRWIRVSPLQEPFDLGPDEAGREQCGFNVVVKKRPSDTFAEELVAVLEAAGVGIPAQSLFASSAVALPKLNETGGAGPFLVLRTTSGPGPEGTHGDGVGAYRRPAAQVLVHARRWRHAEVMAHAAYDALIAVRNRDVVAWEEPA